MATRFDVAATGGTLFNTDAASFALNPNLRAEAFQVRDNSKFVKVFDPAKIIDVFKPTRTLVVSQNPAPGSLVPVGTPVDLIVTVKESIPLGGLKELDPRVVERFNNKNIGDVLLTLQGSDAKNVLDRAGATDYDALSTNDKGVVNEYIKTTYGVDAATDSAGAKSVYGNVKFLNDL